MEQYINNFDDITYMSELSPPFWQGSLFKLYPRQKSGVNSQTALRSTTYVAVVP